MVITTSKKKAFYGWRIVAACFVLLFCFAGSGFYSFSIFINPLENEFGWSRSSISLIASLYFLTGGLFAPWVGRFCQTIGPRKVMFMGAVGAGACFILAGFSQFLWHLYAVYILLALNIMGIAFVPVSSVLTRWFVRRRGTAIGLAYIGTAAGGLVYAPLIGLITARYDWRASFFFLGIMVWVLALPVIQWIIKESPEEMDLLPDGEKSSPGKDRTGEHLAGRTRGNPDIQEGVSLNTALGTGTFWWIGATFFLGATAQMGLLQHQVPLIAENGIPYETAATALGITSAMGGLGKYFLGRLTESIPIQYVVLVCLILQAVGICILLNLVPNSDTLVWIYAVVFGFGMGGVVLLQPLVVGRFFGIRSFGVILGLISLCQSLGSSTGSYVSGLLHDHFGNYRYALLGYLMLYMGAMMTVCIATKFAKKNDGQLNITKE